MKMMIGALFDNLAVAYLVVLKLRLRGFDAKDISLVVQDFRQQRENHAPIRFLNTAKLPEWADYATILENLSAIMVGLTTVTVPGVGPLLASGTVAGQLTESRDEVDLVTTLMNLNMSEDSAESFAEGLQQGEALVAVLATPTARDHAISIMRAFDPLRIEFETSQSPSKGGNKQLTISKDFGTRLGARVDPDATEPLKRRLENGQRARG